MFRHPIKDDIERDKRHVNEESVTEVVEKNAETADQSKHIYFDDVDETIDHNNNTPFGLSAVTMQYNAKLR